METATASPEMSKLRDAFVPNRRVRLASDVAGLCALPLLLGRRRQLALREHFRTRLVIAALLWLAGLIALLARMAALDSSYSPEAGFYVSGGLMLLGLVSTLAMWPGDLPVVKIDRNGTVREATAAGAPRSHSPTGP